MRKIMLLAGAFAMFAFPVFAEEHEVEGNIEAGEETFYLICTRQSSAAQQVFEQRVLGFKYDQVMDFYLDYVYLQGVPYVFYEHLVKRVWEKNLPEDMDKALMIDMSFDFGTEIFDKCMDDIYR